MLGSFGISGDKALQKVVSLSGGQKCRVALAVMAATRPNFLMLDEPTNHLDIETIEALGKAIDKFSVSRSLNCMLISIRQRIRFHFSGWRGGSDRFDPVLVFQA